ncbi:MAG: thioredoxin [Candidatus Altiarchaeota archaeon]
MSNLAELTDESFDDFVKGNSVCVIDFWAPWCGPCMMVGPLVDELAGEYAGKVAFGKLNIDDNKAKAGEFSVMSIPTILFVKDGDVVDKIIGALPKDKIKARIESLL